MKKDCLGNKSCPYKDLLNDYKCWGYEKNCRADDYDDINECPKPGWYKNKQEQKCFFWQTADFGYIKKRRSEMKVICKPKLRSDGHLSCSKHARYCTATNIFMDLRKVSFKGTNRFREDIFREGVIGGSCDLDMGALRSLGRHKSPLQSWYSELENFSELKSDPFVGRGECDVTLDKPTILMKLDSGINMYHHFCDFINLYSSQHINSSFHHDVIIIMWDTTTLPYSDIFSTIWKAFTTNPVIRLSDFKNKRLCIKDAMFPLLARMRYGLYYNMPLIPGCQKSALFRAFNEHLIHRLAIPQTGPLEGKVRVTLLVRSTKYRNILNLIEIVKAVQSLDGVELLTVDFNRQIPLQEQITISHNTDVLLGIHGAGLTHTLFLPHWAAVFELYHCGDRDCYADLARLRGVEFYGWEREDLVHQEDEGHHPQLGAHQMFTNYQLDVVHLIETLKKAIYAVNTNWEFHKALEMRKVENKLESDGILSGYSTDPQIDLSSPPSSISQPSPPQPSSSSSLQLSSFPQPSSSSPQPSSSSPQPSSPPPPSSPQQSSSQSSPSKSPLPPSSSPQPPSSSPQPPSSSPQPPSSSPQPPLQTSTQPSSPQPPSQISQKNTEL